ncbi:MAG: TetR/AcrR family transcriptional regulator [Paracoccaceae bacterium]
MTAPADRRRELTDRMADFVLANGLAAASLRPLAASAGISDRMLLYYFTDKSAAISATLDMLTDRLAKTLQTHITRKPMPMGRLRSKLIPLLLADDLWPYMRLWIETAALAAHGDAQCRKTGQAISQTCQTWIRPQLDSENPNDAPRLMMLIRAAVLQKAIGLDHPADAPAGDD